MRAVVLDTDDRFKVTTLPEPEPGDREVAVRIAYAGVQYGDVLVREGHFQVPRPFVAGFEAAGHIVAVGEGVDPARVGEQVIALLSGGGHAEIATVPSTLAINADGWDMRTAAAFGWFTPAAYDLINEVARVREGDRVLIHAAAGGVGTLAVQFAKSAGASKIVGIVGTTDQVDHATGLGLDEVLVKEAFPEALAEDVFDVILDPIGGDIRVENLALLAPHGRVVVYGNIATFDPVSVSVNDLLLQGQSLLTYNSNLASQTHPERLAASATRAMELVADGSVKIDITAEFDLETVEDAIASLSSGKTPGKSIIRIE